MKLSTQLLKDLLMLIGGAGIFTFSVMAFVVPNGLASAGLTGLTIVIYQVFGLETGVAFWLFNIPLLIAGWHFVGKKLFFLTFIGSQSITVWLMLWQRLPFIQVTFAGNLVILAPILAGIIGGFGISLVLKSGGSTGGTAIVMIMLNHVKGIRMDLTSIVWDASVLLLGLATYLTLPRFGLTLVQAIIISRMVKLFVPNVSKEEKSRSIPVAIAE